MSQSLLLNTFSVSARTYKYDPFPVLRRLSYIFIFRNSVITRAQINHPLSGLWVTLRISVVDLLREYDIVTPLYELRVDGFSFVLIRSMRPHMEQKRTRDSCRLTADVVLDRHKSHAQVKA